MHFRALVVAVALPSAMGACMIAPDSQGRVTIPDSMTSVGANAFLNCLSLTSVAIPDSVTSIGVDAFNACVSLTSIAIPDSVTSIGDGVFADSSLTSVTIPDSVTSVGKNVFNGCTSLTSVVIPNSVTSIGLQAFLSCTSLESVTIPDSVVSIGASAFEDCASLTTVSIPDSVTSVGGDAFNGCTSLTSVTIPDSVTSISVSAFPSCVAFGLATAGQPIADDVDATIAEIPRGVVHCVACANRSSITIPDSVAHIGAAFFGCSSLTSVTVPDSVTSLGAAFFGATSLTSITIPNSVTSVGANAFASCEFLPSVTIPDSVVSIGERAFQGCMSLTTMSIPDSVSSIGAHAFQGCTALTSVTIPDSVVSISVSALPSCIGFGLATAGQPISDRNNVTMTDIPRGAVRCLACGNDLATVRVNVSITIPDAVVAIGQSAFAGCVSLTSVSIPDSVTFIDTLAFMTCGELTSVRIPDSVTSIGQGAFRTCSSLASVTIPNSVTRIGPVAFLGCTSLTSLTFPDSITLIARGAFYGAALTSVAMPNSVTSVGSNAFSSCESIASVTISDSLSVIPQGAFQSCGSLTSVNISDSVTLISNNAFASTALSSVNIPPNTTVATTAFVGTFLCGRDLTEVTADDDAASYDELGVESYHSHVDARIVQSFMFYQCLELVSLSLSDAVRVIRPYAVASCINLNNLTIPDGVVRIERGAFFGSSGLKTIRIPPTVNVSSGAFFGCGCEESLYLNGTALDNCTRGFVDKNTNAWRPYTQCDLGATFESTEGTYTSDFVCSALAVCSNGIAVPPTATTNRVCHPTHPPLNKASEVGVAVAVVVFVLIVVVVVFSLNRMRKTAVSGLEMRERLLHEEQAEKETLYTENFEMKRAWEILEDDLVLERELASGGFGSVWLAKWGHIDVAVKMLKAPLEEDVGGFASEDFNREVSFMQRIRHPNLLIFYGAGVTADGHAFMVVELMRQGSMRKMLLSDRPLTGASRVQMALDIARGMAHLHSLDSIHRDLKSDNCLVSDDLRVKVGDFGASRLLRARARASSSSSSSGGTRGATSFGASSSPSSLLATQMLTGAVGTPLWMAPELLSGENGGYGKEVDVYSFGIVLWEFVTRSTPWGEEITETGIQFIESLQQAVLSGVRPRLPTGTEFPRGFVDLMKRCWSGEPSKRPTFADAAAELASMAV